NAAVLVPLLRAVGTRKVASASNAVRLKLASPDGAIRAAAISALADLDAPGARKSVLSLLGDPDGRVRTAAAGAAGRVGLTDAAERLLELARDADAEGRRTSLDALRRLREPRAVPVFVAALNDGETNLKALEGLGELGGPAQAGAVADLAKRRP